MRILVALGVTAQAVALLTATPDAVELKPATLTVFEKYVALTEARMAGEVEGRSPFLWADRQPEAARRAIFERLGRREIVSERLETRDGRTEIKIKNGMIHHWVGTVLLPRVTLDRAMAFLQDYDRYDERFSPTIQQSRILRKDDRQFVVQMRTWGKKMTVTAVHDADYVIEYRRLSPSRMYTRSVATNIHHVEDAGEPAERRVPGDQSSGYLWRLNTYCWFDERAEGTYEQCESISLTRSAPFGMGWLINRFVEEIPRETLEFTLSRVRDGLAQSAQAAVSRP
jgi:hypothetical protein